MKFEFIIQTYEIQIQHIQIDKNSITVNFPPPITQKDVSNPIFGGQTFAHHDDPAAATAAARKPPKLKYKNERKITKEKKIDCMIHLSTRKMRGFCRLLSCP